MTTHGSVRAEVEQHQSAPRVLLIDSENFFGTISPRPRLLRARLAALLTAAGPVHHAVAAFATTSETGDPLASILAEHRVASLTVAPSPDAAEDALLAHARRVHDSLADAAGWSPPPTTASPHWPSSAGSKYWPGKASPLPTA